MTPLYSQNGELIYPSDSEESLPATNTNNTDNRPASPHSNSSQSPTPAKQSKVNAGSPSCAGRTDNFSPRYSPPTIPNHLEPTAGNPSAATPKSSPDTNSHIDNLSAIRASTQQQDLNGATSQSHCLSTMNPINSQAGLGLPHQIYKTSPQSSPIPPPQSQTQHAYDSMGGYSLPPNSSYQINTQYPHHNAVTGQLNQNPSRC